MSNQSVDDVSAESTEPDKAAALKVLIVTSAPIAVLTKDGPKSLAPYDFSEETERLQEGLLFETDADLDARGAYDAALEWYEKSVAIAFRNN